MSQSARSASSDQPPDQIPGRTPHARGPGYRILAIASAVLIMVLIGVTCVDVIGRYLFNHPFSGAFELTQLALGALVFAALPLTTADGAHVEVDLALHLFKPRTQALLGRVAGFVSALVLMFFAWRLVVLGQTLWHDGARTNALGVPTAPLAFIAAASCVASAIIVIFRRHD